MGLFSNITKSIGKIAPIAIPAMIGFGFGGGSMAGIGSFFSNMSTAQKLGLGVGALALAGGLGQRQEYSFEERPEPVGKDFAMTSRLRDGTIVQLNDPDQLKQYRKEIQTDRIQKTISSRPQMAASRQCIMVGRSTDQGPAHLILCPPACPTVSL